MLIYDLKVMLALLISILTEFKVLSNELLFFKQSNYKEIYKSTLLIFMNLGEQLNAY